MRRCPGAEGIDVVILCGGKGKRLRPIAGNRPKAMVEFNGRPFLSILMEYVASFGFCRFIMCIGYKGAMIKEYYSKKKSLLNILYSKEKIALGTGGAIKRANSLIQSESFLVMNGDSFCRLRLDKFKNFHFRKNALLSIALTDIGRSRNYGKVILNSAQQIVSFEEKGRHFVNNLKNTGIYFMNRKIFSFMKNKRVFSLERDLIPSLIKQGCYGFRQNIDLIDYGTPCGYRRAKRFFRSDNLK